MFNFLKFFKRAPKENNSQPLAIAPQQEDYQPLVNILRQVLIQEEFEEKLRNEQEEADRLAWEKHYFEENREDIAASFVLSALNNKKRGEVETTVSLLNDEGEQETYTVKAYVTDSETLKILDEYILDSHGNPEGYTFEIIIDPDFSKIKVPNCYCEYVSDTFSVEGNCIDSNCDTWGTSYRQKAESLYFFYVEDLQKQAVVKVRYWVL